MSEGTLLSPAVAWVRVETTEEDWDAADAAAAHEHVEPAGARAQLRGVRAGAGRRRPRARPGSLEHRPGGRRGRLGAHPQGRDTVNGSHRGHHQFLAKALAYVEPKGIDPDGRLLRRRARGPAAHPGEICGLDRGFGHGRGGSMHLQWLEAGAIGTNAIVGGGVPLAAGSAWAHSHAGHRRRRHHLLRRRRDATSAPTLETFNLAAAWRLPLCFFVENNLYAVSTSVAEATAEPRLSATGSRVRDPELEGGRDGRRWRSTWRCRRPWIDA